MNTLLRFTKELTEYDPLLRKRVESLYHKIFEGVGTQAALDKLKEKVGTNPMETEGEGVFDLATGAGYEDGKDANPEEALDKAIDTGIDQGNMSDFGTAIPGESMAPTEDDLGFGSDPDETFGNDLGADNSLFDLGEEENEGGKGEGDIFGEDSGSSDDLGLDGLDDEFEEGDEGGDGEEPGDTGDLNLGL